MSLACNRIEECPFGPVGTDLLPSSEITIPAVGDHRDWAAKFDRTSTSPMTRVAQRIFQEVFGDEYPEGLGTHSFLSRTELVRFVKEVKIGPGDPLADVGCGRGGRGGPGLWLIAQTGSQLVGVDISREALESASARAESLGLTHRCRGPSRLTPGIE
jgi:2-polyprenyl-3-methyl-5-hydroxy-6-metoxy-1,4-benzoquinol methylase